MKIKTFFGLLIVLVISSCANRTTNGTPQNENNSNQHLSKTGLKIEYGMNQGIRANAALGITNPFIYTTSIITNDSTIPIHLQIVLSKEYEFPTFCDDDTSKYKVVLLPEELTPDTATLRNTIIGGSEDFFKTCMDNPSTINKTIKPGEYCVITIGTLYPSHTNCEVIPRAVFSYDDIELYTTCDHQLTQAISTEPRFEIGVKLEYYYKRKFIAPEDGCATISCGQFSYAKR